MGKSIWKKNNKVGLKLPLEGFTLIEISIVLLIIGVMVGSVMKGKDLIESAQIRHVVSDIERLQLAYTEYINLYGAYPGDDKDAASKFKGGQNGDGDGKISGSDATKVLSHLFESGLIGNRDYKKPKIGGVYSVKSKNNAAWIGITEPDGSGTLTAKQASLMKARLSEGTSIEESQIFTEPADVDLNNNKEKYSIFVKLR